VHLELKLVPNKKEFKDQLGPLAGVPEETKQHPGSLSLKQMMKPVQLVSFII